MSKISGLRELAWFDCPGGGQVRVDGITAYIGHMASPSGTSLVDVSDPRRPRLLSRVDIGPGTHSHKVRVHDGIMLVNEELTGGETPDGFAPGLGVYDVSEPTHPRRLSTWETTGSGVHRFDFDGHHAYVSASMEGFVGNIVVILDLSDPSRPKVTGKWWIPGQWRDGGEVYPWEGGPVPRCHHPLRMGDRLYTSYWHHGCFILDVSDMSAPKKVSELFIGPAFPHPRHTALPIPFPVRGRQLMIVADEDVAKLRAHAPAFMWVVDITDETNPVPISSWQVDSIDRDGAPPASDDGLPSTERGRDGGRNSVRMVRPGFANRRYRRSTAPTRSRSLPARSSTQW